MYNGVKIICLGLGDQTSLRALMKFSRMTLENTKVSDILDRVLYLKIDTDNGTLVLNKLSPKADGVIELIPLQTERTLKTIVEKLSDSIEIFVTDVDSTETCANYIDNFKEYIRYTSVLDYIEWSVMNDGQIHVLKTRRV